MKRVEIKSLYYITHVDNVPSIVERGILAHAVVERDKVPFTPIYDSQIVSKRREKYVPSGGSLWDYANLYFQPRNPMMYRVVHEKDRESIAVVAVRPTVMGLTNVLISDGNAASNQTEIYGSADGKSQIQKQWDVIQNEWWRDDDGSKRKIMAECLVPERVPPNCIDTIYVANQECVERVRKVMPSASIHVSAEPNIFFQPRWRYRVGKNISLVDGDMFFSDLQTLTVSVNLRGVMGKGLASRAKYQFPDLYVYYQDACRSRKLTATKPCLYKRETSLDAELADLTSPLKTPNAVKWFLLFATKRHWRDKSRIEDIEAGLSWIERNYQTEGIQSLALPALGCGLGGLAWEQVGPIMCRVLSRLSIHSAIYLPRERKIDQEHLKESFLLCESA